MTMAIREPDQTKLGSAQLQALAQTLGKIRGVRKQSEYVFLGLPLYSIAMGPDLAKGEMRGHAKGVIAVGGLAFGIISVGGLSIGVLLALGGAAIGTVAAGGATLGAVAI